MHGSCCQVAEHLTLLRAQLARLPVDDTQGACMGAVTQTQGGAGVETEVRCVGNQRIVGKPRVKRGIGHLENAIAQNGMGAERQLARGFGDAWQADIRLEPLAVCVDQADQRDGHTAHQCGSLNECIELPLWRRVKHTQCLQRTQALRFIRRNFGS